MYTKSCSFSESAFSFEKKSRPAILPTSCDVSCACACTCAYKEVHEHEMLYIASCTCKCSQMNWLEWRTNSASLSVCCYTPLPTETQTQSCTHRNTHCSNVMHVYACTCTYTSMHVSTCTNDVVSACECLYSNTWTHSDSPLPQLLLLILQFH